MSSRPRIVPPDCVHLRKVIVTPTTINLSPPTIETSNRIVRHFEKTRDYFMRVEFSDEGSSRLWSKDSASNENNAIYNRIFTALTNGIKIGDRTYHFLAFSASQLRENSAWFFCDQGGTDTVESIHQWMGDFSLIKSIAKYAARMGQCFSSTRAIDSLASSEVEMINDIEHHQHNFSDGCGRLSKNLCQKIGIELEKETIPTAFQIRYEGSKGVLVLYPPLEERKIQIRPSMKKFEVAHRILEVIRTSSYIGSYLNRQIIILITALGVPDKVILDLKDKMMRDLEQLESDDTIAIKTLLQYWDEHGTSKMMVTMIRSGFLRIQDPFIKNLLTLFKYQTLEELSKKARIHVPKGAYLLGVCDETGKLNEGEIFVQVSTVENSTKREVIEGNCIVVRCPCFHPGDVRVVRAVKCEALKHLHDVVVFNTKGVRGIPSMCSGGDLDGDGKVIWDPNIVSMIKTQEPMDYTSKAPNSNSKDVTILDIKKFFVQYAVSDNLGVIANAHLALSDQLAKGPFDPKCLRLAELHSDAVDFPKSGIPAVISPELRPRQYPDFMEKPPDKSYPSRRVLGRIYRECSGQGPFSPKDYSQSFNKMLLVNGYEDYMGEARRIKGEYDDAIRSLMNQYGVKR
ncbi:RNA-dependent RNA polymerase [Mortierella sp. GBAus27b]|nr:RNA-dependent RNA polymerase [Mortierella sp. GBAus27b]